MLAIRENKEIRGIRKMLAIREVRTIRENLDTRGFLGLLEIQEFRDIRDILELRAIRKSGVGRWLDFWLRGSGSCLAEAHIADRLES